MFFIRFIRFIMGYVVFSAKGGFPERFINLCANHSVVLWDVKCRSNVLTARTTIKGYRNIRKAAKRSGMLPRISERHGLPFFMHRYRRRVGVVAGAAVAFAILILLSSMIWIVNIEGNESFETETLIIALEELGLKPGTRRNSIDATEIKERILERYPELIWAALNIGGSTATLEVREGIKPPEMFDINSPCNIIAAFDGEIIKLNAFTGEAAAKLGSAVKKGDLLISGITAGTTHTRYVHAKGDVIARTSRTISASVDKNFVCKTIGEDKIRYSIYIFGIRIPLGFGLSEYDEYAKNDSMLNSKGKIFPIGIRRERYSVFEDSTIELSTERARLICLNKYYNEYRESLSEAEIINAELSFLDDKNLIKITGKYKAEEDIGTEQYFEVEEGH